MEMLDWCEPYCSEPKWWDNARGIRVGSVSSCAGGPWQERRWAFGTPLKAKFWAVGQPRTGFGTRQCVLRWDRTEFIGIWSAACCSQQNSSCLQHMFVFRYTDLKQLDRAGKVPGIGLLLSVISGSWPVADHSEALFHYRQRFRRSVSSLVTLSSCGWRYCLSLWFSGNKCKGSPLHRVLLGGSPTGCVYSSASVEDLVARWLTVHMSDLRPLQEMWRCQGPATVMSRAWTISDRSKALKRRRIALFFKTWAQSEAGWYWVHSCAECFGWPHVRLRWAKRCFRCYHQCIGQ